MNITRFSKKTLLLDLLARIDSCEKEYGFDSTNGYTQVSNTSDAMKYAFGRYSAYLDLLEEISQ